MTGKCTVGCRFDENCGSGEYCHRKSGECKPECNSNTSCTDDEYCDIKQHKCIGVCDVSACGDNSICTIKDRNQYCSCDVDYFPEKGVGCRPLTGRDNLSNETCSLYCEPFASCEFNDETVYCFCPFRIPFLNPFINCDIGTDFISIMAAKTFMIG